MPVPGQYLRLIELDNSLALIALESLSKPLEQRLWGRCPSAGCFPDALPGGAQHRIASVSLETADSNMWHITDCKQIWSYKVEIFSEAIGVPCSLCCMEDKA